MLPFTLENYAMGRDKLAPAEWELAKPNAEILIQRVNEFLMELAYGIDYKISSGFRYSGFNDHLKNAAKHSLHMSGKAVDVWDPQCEFKRRFDPLYNGGHNPHAELLRKYELFMEHPAYTRDWFHLDMGTRDDRPSRVFTPY